MNNVSDAVVEDSHSRENSLEKSITSAILGIAPVSHGTKLPPHMDSEERNKLLLNFETWRQARKEKLTRSILAKRKHFSNTKPSSLPLLKPKVSNLAAKTDAKQGHHDGKKNVFDRLYEKSIKNNMKKESEENKNGKNSVKKLQNGKLSYGQNKEKKRKLPRVIVTSEAENIKVTSEISPKGVETSSVADTQIISELFENIQDPEINGELKKSEFNTEKVISDYQVPLFNDDNTKKNVNVQNKKSASDGINVFVKEKGIYDFEEKANYNATEEMRDQNIIEEEKEAYSCTEEKGQYNVIERKTDSDTEERGDFNITEEMRDQNIIEEDKGAYSCTEEKGQYNIIVGKVYSDTEEVRDKNIIVEEKEEAYSSTEEKGQYNVVERKTDSDAEGKGDYNITEEMRDQNIIVEEKEEAYSCTEEKGQYNVVERKTDSDTEEVRDKNIIVEEKEEAYSSTEEKGQYNVVERKTDSDAEEKGDHNITEEMRDQNIIVEEKEEAYSCTEEKGQYNVVERKTDSDTEEVRDQNIIEEDEGAYSIEEKGQINVMEEKISNSVTEERSDQNSIQVEQVSIGNLFNESKNNFKNSQNFVKKGMIFDCLPKNKYRPKPKTSLRPTASLFSVKETDNKQIQIKRSDLNLQELKITPKNKNNHCELGSLSKSDVDRQSIKDKKSVCFLTPRPSSFYVFHMRNKLENWLVENGHSIDTYRHLRCFGLSAERTPHPLQQRQENLDESLNASFYSTAPNTPIPEIVDESVKENVTPPVLAPKVEKVDPKDIEGWLNDLHRLIVHVKYPSDRCEEWLSAIAKKFPSCTQLAIYWECLAAMGVNYGDNSESEKEENKRIKDNQVEDQLAELLDKLVIDEKCGSALKTERGLSAKNIFTSKTVKFALKEKTMKQVDPAQGTEACQKVLVATPVRRSARVRIPDESNVITSLKSLDPKVRQSLSFKPNEALYTG